MCSIKLLKMRKKLIHSVIIALVIITPLSGSEIENLWGITRNDLITKKKIENYITFKPADNPEYKNRVIDFFSAMNSDSKADIIILRTQGKPEIDYCFFNTKLYSITEVWYDVENNKAQAILKTINDIYPQISYEKKNPEFIYSFKKDRTKVLVYKKIMNDNSVNMKVVYYSMDLFGMLLSE